MKKNSYGLDFDKLQSMGHKGMSVLPVVIQDWQTLSVLLVGYVNALALEKTQETGLVTLWSTSRDCLWVKGQTSGDFLVLKEIRVNCEENSLLFLVAPQGHGCCHVKTGEGLPQKTCFFRRIEGDHLAFL